MNWKNRLTNYNFWVSIVSAVILILQALKIKFDFVYINEVVTAVLGLLVVIGIINDPTKSSSKPKDNAEQVNNEQKNLENSKNEPKIDEKIENNGENIEKEDNFLNNSQVQNEKDAFNVNNVLPNEQTDETADGDIQTDTPIDALNETENESKFFNIVNQ